MAGRKSAGLKFEDSGGSPSGYHFFNLYEMCQYKMFLRYVLGWVPNYSTPALVNGSATHYAKEVFYKAPKSKKDSARLKLALDAYVGYMSAFQKKIEAGDREKFQTLYDRGKVLIGRWADEQGFADIRKYEILGVEQECQLPIRWRSKTFRLTGKMDLLVRDREDRRIYILDTKTTSFSIKEVELGLNLGDQATAYIAMAKRMYPGEVAGFIGDILYWHDATKDVERATVKRTPVITRSDEQIKQFVLGTGALIAEVSAKVGMFRNGKVKEPGEMFRRNGGWCNSYFKACEYAPYCKNGAAYKLWKEGKVGFDYHVEKSNLKAMEEGQV